MKIGMGTLVAQNARRTSLKQFSPASRSVALSIFGNITGALIDATRSSTGYYRLGGFAPGRAGNDTR
jgi:hypothetical protein